MDFYDVDYDVITWTYFSEDVTMRLGVKSAPVLRWENYDNSE